MPVKTCYKFINQFNATQGKAVMHGKVIANLFQVSKGHTHKGKGPRTEGSFG